MRHKIVLCGGSGLLAGRYLARRVPRETMDRDVLAIDVDGTDLCGFPGRTACIGLPQADAQETLEDPQRSGAPAAVRLVCEDAALRSTFAKGTDAGACRAPIFTVASVGEADPPVETLLRQMMAPDLADERGARFRFHLVGGGGGGAGSALLVLLSDLLRLRRRAWPVDSVRVWMLHAGLLTEDLGEKAVEDDDRARMAAVQAFVDERLRRVALAPAESALTDLSFEILPRSLVTRDARVREISRDHCARQYAAALALLVRSGLPSLAATAEANTREQCDAVVTTERD
jgi:hypothetical protein